MSRQEKLRSIRHPFVLAIMRGLCWNTLYAQVSLECRSSTERSIWFFARSHTSFGPFMQHVEGQFKEELAMEGPL